MALSSAELERYARHIVLADVGGEGQQKLKSAKVLVVGAGGLGSPVLQYLAAAGVGVLGVVDDDLVSLSNLQRQTIHTTDRAGLTKVDSAKYAVEALNPEIKLIPFRQRLTGGNGTQIISQFDLVVDGTDNFETRYLVAGLCENLQIPLVTAAVGQFDASITTLKPYEKDADGNWYPKYSDIFPVRPPDGLLPTCEEAGIIGALTGVIGSMQAMEVIKELLGIGEGLAGRLILYNSKRASWSEVRVTLEENGDK